MTAAVAIACIFAFLFIFGRLGAVGGVRAMLAATLEATAAVRDKRLSDLEREETARHGALVLVRGAVLFLLRTAISLAGAFGVVWLADKLGAVKSMDVANFMMRVDVIIVGTVLGTIAVWLVAKFKPT